MQQSLFRRFLSGLWRVLVLCGWSAAAAGSGMQQLEQFLDGLQSLRAGFEQSVVSADRTQQNQARGVFYLLRPERFRWDYVAPYEQQLIADGRQVWAYDPEIEQVSVQFQGQALRGTPAQLLASDAPVATHFDLTEVGPRGELEWVELIPKDDQGQFTRILLGFVQDRLQRMELTDRFGQLTRFRFYDMERNPQLDPGLFVFDPPESYEVFKH